jgi:hypothetical protein
MLSGKGIEIRDDYFTIDVPGEDDTDSQEGGVTYSTVIVGGIDKHD